VKVKLFASFRDGRFIEKEWAYSEGLTVGRILKELAIDKKEVGVVFVNSHPAQTDYKLGEGDTLSIFPLIGGG
jgi:molybdopterin converting factor small subunit